LVVAVALVCGEHTAFVAARIIGTRVAVVAGDLYPGGALAGFARIPDRTGLPVGAGIVVGHILARALLVATVVGARVIVEAYDRLTETDPRFAMVAVGASVTIEAFPLIQELIGAAGFPSACVRRARVPIVTGPVVDEAVAVVIDSITGLDARVRRVANAKPVLSA
jgi:hypothetical protein